MPLTAKAKRSVGSLLDGLVQAADELVSACRKDDWDTVQNLVPKVKSFVRSIKDEVPRGIAKSQLTELDRHAQFVEVYTKKRDLGYVLSNTHSIRPDTQRLKAALAIGGKDELREAVEALPKGPERDLLDEAIRCLEAEAPRASVVMAVCSLESLLRHLWESKTGQDSKKLDFWEVIDEVSKLQGLTDSEKGLLNLCRPFRNFAAHPSEYTHSTGEAAGLIHLAAEKVKKWGK